MTAAELPSPGPVWGDYPERKDSARAGESLVLARWRGAMRPLVARALARVRGPGRDAAWLAQVQAAVAVMQGRDLTAEALQVRMALRRDGLVGPALLQAFALVASTAERELGRTPFSTQLLAARAVLGCELAQMATGEGKTLAVALAAAVAALAGIPVHVVTANDYLAQRDAQTLAPLFAALNLSVGCVVQADGAEARVRAYACDLTYVTARELAFDYLRDRLANGPSGAGGGTRFLRGLCMAIVDEADAVLIDDARTPLILTRADASQWVPADADNAMALAQCLQPGVHYELDAQAMQAVLTPRGERRVSTEATHGGSPAWNHPLHRQHLVCTALAALHLFQRDRHYFVRAGKLLLIDEATGRHAAGRMWSQGLQQLVEHKEGLDASPTTQTLAQITFQRFFRRYLRLGGVSGTLAEARAELQQTYALPVRHIPLRRPCRRRVEPARLHADRAALWASVVRAVQRLHGQGRPVLLAAESVADAEAIAEQLTQAGLPHTVLHARQDADEARVVAQAGQHGAITVTTNMAGRGTDIQLGVGVEALGGLHVVCCQLNGARRIDRQLAGRAARQGDAGSVQTLLSLDNALFAHGLPRPLLAPLRRHAATVPSWAVRALVALVQSAAQRQQRLQRQRLIEYDERSERDLAFAGHFE